MHACVCIIKWLLSTTYVEVTFLLSIFTTVVKNNGCPNAIYLLGWRFSSSISKSATFTTRISFDVSFWIIFPIVFCLSPKLEMSLEILSMQAGQTLLMLLKCWFTALLLGVFHFYLIWTCCFGFSHFFNFQSNFLFWHYVLHLFVNIGWLNIFIIFRHCGNISSLKYNVLYAC